MSGIPGFPPGLWMELTEEDKAAFTSTTDEIRRIMCGTHKIDDFFESFELLLHFIDSAPKNNAERSMLAGFVCSNQFILLNFRQLMQIFERPKFELIGAIKKMGYEMYTKEENIIKLFNEILPDFTEHPQFSRQWVIYVKTGNGGRVFTSVVDNDIKESLDELTMEEIQEIEEERWEPSIGSLGDDYMDFPDFPYDG